LGISAKRINEVKRNLIRTGLRRLIRGAGERQGRASEPQLAAMPVATRNGLASPANWRIHRFHSGHFIKGDESLKTAWVWVDNARHLLEKRHTV
jgi:hypothetical protein